MTEPLVGCCMGRVSYLSLLSHFEFRVAEIFNLGHSRLTEPGSPEMFSMRVDRQNSMVFRLTNDNHRRLFSKVLQKRAFVLSG